MNSKIISKRFIIMTVAIALSVIYSIPNLYPDRPTLILASEVEISTQVISDKLTNHNLEHTWINDTHIQFPSVDIQMKARDILSQSLNQNQLSLNLEPQTPNWLSRLGAHPMKYGLDLQGGIHFLLEVDTSHIEKSQLENETTFIKEWLKSQRIRYREVNKNGSQLEIILLDPSKADTTASSVVNHFTQYKVNIDDGDIILTAINDNKDAIQYAVDQTISSLEKRINELGISEATIQRQGSKYISIDLPGIQDIVHAKKIIGKTATLKLQLVDSNPDSVSKHLPDANEMMIPLHPKAVLSGESIAFAHAKLSDGQAVVEIQLDGQAHDFYQATANNVGKRLAVVYSEMKHDVLDEHIISAPVIKQPLGDNFVIQGSGSLSEAKDLALLLRSGALAAPVKFIEETTIGPSLGNDNIIKGVVSLLVGSSIIFVFMTYYYRMFGLIANIALLLNIGMIISMLSLIGATLTLPGIAGIVLSVGMAVDANVLINERIREETLAGKSLRSAVIAGYNKALSAIIDANVTTLLVTFVLFSLGSGAVKGFAITTCMGIIASVFTSVYFTQALTDLLINTDVIQSVNLSHDWFSKLPNINFMKLSRKAFMFSLALLTSCALVIPIKGINLGLDFTGGQQLTLETNGEITAEDIRNTLEKMGIKQAQVQTFGSSETFVIKIGQSESNVNDTAASLAARLPSSRIIQAEFIGPQVGDSMLKSSVKSVLIALAITMLYVAMRFEYRFAVSAIISLIHDPLLILGIFAVSQIEFNLIALAAMLTILGYSINDTIVVYDRVRENFISSLNLDTETVINDAINQTLSRTILTSCLTLSVVLALYFFGGDYLSGFSLSLAVGIIIGTYSSIYIAGSLAVYLGLKRDDLITPSEVGEIL